MSRSALAGTTCQTIAERRDSCPGRQFVSQLRLRTACAGFGPMQDLGCACLFSLSSVYLLFQPTFKKAQSYKSFNSNITYCFNRYLKKAQRYKSFNSNSTFCFNRHLKRFKVTSHSIRIAPFVSTNMAKDSKGKEHLKKSDCF